MSLVLHEKDDGTNDGDSDAGDTTLTVPSSRSSVGEFLNSNGLGDFAEHFRQQGFRYAEDVLGLTPRKYKVVGVESLGDSLRLSNLLDVEVRTSPSFRPTSRPS